MKKKKMIYEGKAKKVYTISEPDQLIQEFKDDATAFNGEKKGMIKNKGEVNNQVSAFLFKYLNGFNIPTHYIKSLSSREMLIKQLEMIPVEIVMRNVAAGSLCERYGLEEGQELSCPVQEFYLKDEKRHDPMINQSHIIAFGMATADELKIIERIASKINAVLKSYFLRREIKLVDFKLEFGRYKNKILLGDEISPDTCRFWDVSTGEKLDKDRFRFDLGNVEQAYEEIKNRILK